MGTIRRPCLDCGTPTDGTRCPTHRRQRSRNRSRRRGTSEQQGYGTAYQRARAQAGIGGPGYCWCCHTHVPRTTADHVPPLATGKPSILLPACHQCNDAHCAQRRHDNPTLTSCPRSHSH